MSDSAFRTELSSLREVFSKTFFAIPDYQRNYSWGEKQVKDLLEDIGSMVDANSAGKHYTGTLVLTASENRADAYDVIDGQQRLISLSILVNSLARLAQEEQIQNDLVQTYVRRGNRGDERDVIDVQSDCVRYFREAVMDYREKAIPEELDAHSRLLQARRVIDQWLHDRQESGTKIATIQDVVENRLGFLVFAPRNSADAGTMFEVINNRGKALSELEKIKNYLVYASAKLNASDTRKRIDSAWTSIQKNLNRAGKVRRGEESAFVRYSLIVFAGLSKQESQSGRKLPRQVDSS